MKQVPGWFELAQVDRFEAAAKEETLEENPSGDPMAAQ